MKPKILLVEDDVFLRDGLTHLLTREGYEPVLASRRMEAETKVAREPFALIILDIGLPDGNGLDLCVRWRSEGLTTPILFLTARDEEHDIVRALDAGGDDYLTKPFRMQELLSRIRALLRRAQSTVIDNHGLRIDLTKHTIMRDGGEILLTPTEFQILAVFVRHHGQTLTREQLLQAIWDEGGAYIDDNTLSVHIYHIRDKIGRDVIRTIRGVGYRWEGITP